MVNQKLAVDGDRIGGLIPTVYAIGFGVMAGCVLLISTAIGKRAPPVWITVAFSTAAVGQYLAFRLIFQEDFADDRLLFLTGWDLLPQAW